ncbi:MAG: LysR family transcriptional regulator [Clostridia bacterium]|nr:LysR family transcriptional regulator [Clostridia bacterium]
MLLRQLRYFIAVVEAGSFTEAAEQCYISQSAISQQIQALERELDVELIRRENRRFSLTAAGEHFYRTGRGLMGEIEKLCRETARIGKNDSSQLKIGYLRCYGGLELHQAIAEFASKHPNVVVSTTMGTHEELYDQIRFGLCDLVLNDQRRAFSDAYVNFELIKCDCFVEISCQNHLSGEGCLSMEDVRKMTCILISSREQQAVEQDFYQNTLGFGGSFLFAESREEGQLMVVGNRGFMPVEQVGTLTHPSPLIKRLPLCLGDDERLKRNYCAFWKKDQQNPHVPVFAQIYKRLLHEAVRE